MDIEGENFSEDIVKEKFPKLHSALWGAKESFQKQLALSSLFLMSFECLKSYFENNFKSMFCSNFDFDEKGELNFRMPKEFERKKKDLKRKFSELVANIVGDRIKDASFFQISLAWFHEMGAIDNEDFLMIYSANKIRNDLAHELFKWMIDDGTPVLNRNAVYNILNQYYKVSNWWWVNFELELSSEGMPVDDGEAKSAMALNVQVLLHILDRYFPDEN